MRDRILILSRVLPVYLHDAVAFSRALCSARRRGKLHGPGKRVVVIAALCLVGAMPQSAQETAATHYQKGAAHFQSGRITDAVREFEAAIQLAPSDARVWKALGVVHASLGSFGRAQEPFRKACELDPSDADSCYYLGNVSHGLGHYETAIEAYEKALKAAGQGDPRLHSGLGLSLDALGRYSAAERELRKAVQYGAGRSIPNLDPQVELGAFLFRQGNVEAALDALSVAVKARPDSARAHFELARTMVQLNRLDDAVSHLSESVRLDPDYAPPYLLLGRVYFRLGRDAEGERQTQIGHKLTAAADQARIGAQQASRAAAPQDQGSDRPQRP